MTTNDYNGEEEVLEVEQGVQENEETIEETAEEEADDEVVTLSKAEYEKLKKDLSTTKAQKDHYKTKASQPAEKTKETESLSFKDAYALQEAKVHIDDVDEVVEIANLKRISITEALKLSITRAILKEKSEVRATKQAQNKDIRRKGNSATNSAEILNNLSKGNIPKKGSTEAEELFWAKRGGKPN